MSLILEALRKSEAERRRAQVPDLLTEPQVAAPVAVRGPNRMPLIAATSVVVLAAAWFALRPAAPPATTDTLADAPQAAPVDATPAPPTPAPATPAPALRRPLVVAAPAPAAPPQAAPAEATPRIESPPTAPIEPLPAAARAEAAPPPAPVPATDAYLRVSDLGSEDRKQLPPLKLSMHMWNQVASQRFVIIDGTRLSVGDHLGALVVSDIVPDGVVLDWNGRALKLPLR
ncbi:general secretion pathway protein GspB [Lysobacter sp. KIS68-7]|uniref:general secretion pathway protein GspB n=1 Tax=Lysobacter sp. KIS68-7 TaxID=2904252 RepID=UPI001E62089F|nr:general secretion pathway protein GspB [Lysobacter sp. KIS68-7]UHQ18201.1 general secretion pathway protein GspB [Lysobacter sp. KIS68-7]